MNNLYILYFDSGDHVNSLHIRDILYQFSHLIVRNAYNDKFRYLNNIIQKQYGSDFDSNCCVAMIYQEVDYKRFIELNYVYQVILMSLKCIESIKYPFILELIIKIVQHDVNTTNATIRIAPVFARSNL